MNEKKGFDIEKANEIETYEAPMIEVVEIVCQNTPDWTHGSGC